MKHNRTRRISAGIMALAFVVGGTLVGVPRAEAASLTNTYVRLNRMSAGTATSFRLVFKTASAGATSLSVNFNGADSTTWTGSSGLVAASQTASSASCATEASATALPGTLAASGSGSTVSITGVTALAAATTYCVDLTSASSVTNATANEYHPVVTVGSDNTTVAIRTVSNDQVVVTATVAPTFNFVLSGNTDTFTTSLSAGSVNVSNGVTATVNTNARTGWIAWAKDSNSGLTSATAAKTLPAVTPGTAATVAAGTEAAVLAITNIGQGSGAGTTTAATAYDGTGGANTGSGLDGTIRQIASSNGTASSATLTLKQRVTIAPTTPAANDYTDTITVIGAGSF